MSILLEALRLAKPLPHIPRPPALPATPEVTIPAYWHWPLPKGSYPTAPWPPRRIHADKP